MKKNGLSLPFAALFCLSSLSFGAVPPAAWTGIRSVSWVTNVKSNGYLLFKTAPSGINDDCHGRGNLKVTADREAVSEAILMTAQSAASPIRVHYTGNNCEVDDIQMCATSADCQDLSLPWW